MTKPITDESLLTVRTLKEAITTFIEPHFIEKNAKIEALESALSAMTAERGRIAEVAIKYGNPDLHCRCVWNTDPADPCPHALLAVALLPAAPSTKEGEP
jgi:hypothetical protein